MKGYFQSYKYFEEVDSIVKNEFRIKRMYKNEYLQYVKLHLIPNKYCCLHMRRGDYFEVNPYNLAGLRVLALPDDYYNETISKIMQEYLSMYFVLISDDRDYADEIAKKYLVRYNCNCHISLSSEIVDFQTMMNATFCIVSNSSFSC